jgi:hypothetical protein
MLAAPVPSLARRAQAGHARVLVDGRRHRGGDGGGRGGARLHDDRRHRSPARRWGVLLLLLFC